MISDVSVLFLSSISEGEAALHGDGGPPAGVRVNFLTGTSSGHFTSAAVTGAPGVPLGVFYGD